MSPRLSALGLRLILILACVVGALASANQSRLVLLARLDPQAALDADPLFSPAALMLGDVLLLKNPGGAVAKRIHLARTALYHEPLSAGALSQIGMARDAGRIAPETRPYMTLAERLSRRDGFAQLWLAQDCLRAGDVVGGLTHIDTVIRVFQNAEGLIFPALAKFVNEPRIASALAMRSDAGADWVEGFLNYLLAKNGDPKVIAQVLMAIRDPSRMRNGPDIVKETIRVLAVAGDAELARVLFERALSAKLFGEKASLAAIPWRVFDQPGATAEVRNTSSGPVLDILAERGTAATVAQQVRFDTSEGFLRALQLREASMPAGARITLKARCGVGDDIILWSVEGRSSANKRTLNVPPARISPRCPTALYSIEVVGPTEDQALAVSVGLPQRSGDR